MATLQQPVARRLDELSIKAARAIVAASLQGVEADVVASFDTHPELAPMLADGRLAALSEAALALALRFGEDARVPVFAGALAASSASSPPGSAGSAAVDTHVTRLAGRMGLSAETDPELIEADLMKLLPRDRWIDASHRLILHGRYVCTARSPDCGACVVADLCPSRAE